MAAMSELDRVLFAQWNLAPDDPSWAVALARMASEFLPPLALVSLVAIIVLGSRRWLLLGLEIVLAMVIVWLLAYVINDLWPHPRPFSLGIGYQWIEHKPTSGFPSRHGSVGMAFGFAALFASPKRWIGVLGLFIGLAIAWSRVALGVHFPSDVIAGAAIAAAVAAGVHGTRRCSDTVMRVVVGAKPR